MTEPLMSGEEREGLAGEYVLGTLDATERQRAEAFVQSDAEFAGQVNAWRERLAPLDEAVAPVPVPEEVWRKVEAGISGLEERAAELDDNLNFGAVFLMEDMRRRVAFWRRSALVGGALAACLAAIIVSSPPQFLLTPFGAGAPAEVSGRFVAVVNRAGDLPALLVNVDAASGVVEVRSVTAERPADKSLQLWYAKDDQAAPVSLGLIDATSDVTRLAASHKAVFEGDNPHVAISVEPLGGSPTGGPTGPVIYSGKLIPVE